jgi:putative PIG3 family NAD(P)H quinone oxidoreductase
MNLTPNLADLPTTMQAIGHGKGGGPEVLEPIEVTTPRPGPSEVLIKVAYAGVNRPDILQRSGRYPPPNDASQLIGLEVAGHIVALGEAVEIHPTTAVGIAVCALCNGGGYAQYVAVPAGQVLPIPAGLSLAQAAALPENLFTVWHNVVERGHLAAGETFLVHGGSSGIGLNAIGLAKARGATVYCTVGDTRKAAACIEAGADAAIVYRSQDFVEEIARLTGGRGVDLILDMVGGDYVARNLRTLALDGRLVQIAFQQPSRIEVDWITLMTRRLTFTGSTLRPRSREDKAAMARALEAEVWPLLSQGTLLPVIDSTYPLANAVEAHRRMETSQHIGKILLEVPQST